MWGAGEDDEADEGGEEEDEHELSVLLLLSLLFLSANWPSLIWLPPLVCSPDWVLFDSIEWALVMRMMGDLFGLFPLSLFIVSRFSFVSFTYMTNIYVSILIFVYR